MPAILDALRSKGENTGQRAGSLKTQMYSLNTDKGLAYLVTINPPGIARTWACNVNTIIYC